MSRCVLLPTPADPVFMELWVRQYEKCIADHIDSLYVYANSETEKYDFSHVSKLKEIITADELVGHGEALKALVDISSEDIILLLEDDCFVFDRNYIDRIFRGVEKGEYDCAGSPRMSCAVEVRDVAEKRFNLDYTGLGDKGPAFWPNGFFIKRSDLLKTDLNFGAVRYSKGEYVKHLDHTFEEDADSDTMVHLSLQVRSLGIRINEIPQYHGSLDELENYKYRKGIWDGYAPWTHTGSSSSIVSTLRTKIYHYPTSPQEFKELERRIAWWFTAYSFCKTPYARKCEDIMHEWIKTAGLSYKNINVLSEAYKELL